MIQARESVEWSPGSNRSLCPVAAESCLLPRCRGLQQCGRFLPCGTRCIIDGWLIGNSITQRLLGRQTVGHRYPVRTIELEHRREGKVSFRDASPPSADLLGMPSGRSLVHSLTDDLPDNCGCSRAASRQRSAARSSGVNLLRGSQCPDRWRGCTFHGCSSRLVFSAGARVHARVPVCVFLCIILCMK